MVPKRVRRTYLEMTKRPVYGKIGFDEDILIMQATKPTVSFYRFLYYEVGQPWNWVDRRKMSDEALQEIIQNPCVQIHVIYKKGIPAGYVELNGNVSDEIEIAYFGLMPECIGGGLGKKFLQWSILKAWSMDVQRVWLHTCTLDHPSALLLYKRMGFVAYDSEEYEFK